MADLPSLHALRIFETAARTGSFTQAAAVLGVTQSAVSKQVALLEAQLGCRLFERAHRRLHLTDDGHRVAEAAAEALSLLRRRLAPAEPPETATIYLAADADFAALWLMPRLAAFESAHPGLRVSIDSAVGLNAPPRGAFDCAVIWGRGRWPGHGFRPLMTNTVFPVAAPGFFAARGQRAGLDVLQADDLIHDQSREWWSALMAAAGRPGPTGTGGRIYGQTALCLMAAERGDGVTVGDEVSTQGHLAEGRLVAFGDLRLPSPESYYLVWPQDRAPGPAVRRFMDWLAEAAADHAAWMTQFWTGAQHRSASGPPAPQRPAPRGPGS